MFRSYGVVVGEVRDFVLTWPNKWSSRQKTWSVLEVDLRGLSHDAILALENLLVAIVLSN